MEDFPIVVDKVDDALVVVVEAFDALLRAIAEMSASQLMAVSQSDHADGDSCESAPIN